MRRLRLVRNLTRVYAKSPACCGGALRWRIGLGCVYTSWVLAVFFQVDGDEDELEVGEEGLVGPVWRVAALRWCFMRLKTRSTMFRPPRETPTDREPSFSAPRPRAGGPVESAAAWLRAFVSSRDLFCLATENRTRTRAMPLSQAQTKVRKISGVVPLFPIYGIVIY